MNKKLINRLSRIQGQIESLKRSLETEETKPDQCLKNLQLLKASINGLKKFGAAYMHSNAESCLSKNKNKDLQEIIKMAINTGFDI